MRKVSVLLILILISLKGLSQNDSLQARLVLIGDAGDFKKGKHPVIDAVKEIIQFDKKQQFYF